MAALQASDAAEAETLPVATPARSGLAPPVVPSDDMGVASGHEHKLAVKKETVERSSSKAGGWAKHVKGIKLIFNMSRGSTCQGVWINVQYVKGFNMSRGLN